jgi:hypothetical protein
MCERVTMFNSLTVAYTQFVIKLTELQKSAKRGIKVSVSQDYYSPLRIHHTRHYGRGSLALLLYEK